MRTSVYYLPYSVSYSNMRRNIAPQSWLGHIRIMIHVLSPRHYAESSLVYVGLAAIPLRYLDNLLLYHASQCVFNSNKIKQ